MGSTHAFGDGAEGYPNAIRTLNKTLRSGRMMLFGEGYWKQPPAAEYLKFLGEPAGVYRDHIEIIALAEECGFMPMYAAVSSDDEWDHFEWSSIADRFCVLKRAPKQPKGPRVSSEVLRDETRIFAGAEQPWVSASICSGLRRPDRQPNVLCLAGTSSLNSSTQTSFLLIAGSTTRTPRHGFT